MAHDPNPAESASPDQEAKALMRRGIVLMNEGGAVSLREAIRCFDRAIALRAALPLDEDPWIRYGLCAGWLNRGDALMRLGTPAERVVAKDAFSRALEELNKLPLDHDPLFRRRLAIAHLNRGVCLQAQGTLDDLREAIRSFDAYLDVIAHPALATLPDRLQLAASGWTNRGNALLQLPSPDAAGARESALKAIAIVAGVERQEAVLAEVGMKARHVLCRAIALLLPVRSAESSGLELVHEATDAVEQGLAVARLWAGGTGPDLRSLELDLFRFGARVYQVFQPHFLTEFLLEQLNELGAGRSGKAELEAAALETLWRAAAELQADDFSAVQWETLLSRLAELRTAEEKLRSLRRSAFRHADPKA